MIDMMGNIDDARNIIQQLKSNPTKYFNLPQGVNANDPNSIIQHLLNTGQISQQRLNRTVQMAQNNPIINMLMKH